MDLTPEDEREFRQYQLYRKLTAGRDAPYPMDEKIRRALWQCTTWSIGDVYDALNVDGLLLTDERRKEIERAAYRAGREDAAKVVEDSDVIYAWEAVELLRGEPTSLGRSEPSPSEHTQDGGERRGLDPETVPQWERELIERQAQEMERGSE